VRRLTWTSSRTRRDWQKEKEERGQRCGRETKEGSEVDSHHLNDLGLLPRSLVVRPSQLLSEPEKSSFSLGSDELELSSLGVLVLEGGRVENESVVEQFLGSGVEDRVDVGHVEREVLSAVSRSFDFSFLSDNLKRNEGRKSGSGKRRREGDG